MSKDPREIVQELVQMIGKRKAERLLISENISPSVANKLARNAYPSEIGELVAAAILRAKEAALRAS